VAPEGERRIAGLFWLAVALGSLSAAHAIFAARDLVYDGSYYLLRIAAHARFQPVEPARALVQILQQCFAVAGERAGIRDLPVLARLLSLGTSGWPIVLTSACWFMLPQPEKSWIAGPLFNLALVIPTTNLIGVGEGIIASCLLWLLLFAVLFRMNSVCSALAAIALAAAGGFTHETAFPFMAGLSLIAAMRATRTGGWERAALIAVAVAAALATMHLVTWVIFPRDPFERSAFLDNVLRFSFVGTVSEPNFPFLASAAAALAVVASWIPGKRQGVGVPVCIAFAGFAILIVLMMIYPDRVISPWRNFACRALPVMFTTLAALGMILLRARHLPSPFRNDTGSPDSLRTDSNADLVPAGHDGALAGVYE
jgi:hypothetical protein